jgi:RNA polymerase sigma-70 factor (ECF subfamily)
LVEDLFRAEHAHLVAALTRILGPANVALAEDVVQDALVSAMHAWRFGPPRDPKAWIVRAARNRAIDIIRRERRGMSLLPELAETTAMVDTIDAALAPAADRANQLAMMFAVCDSALTPETHVTLILRWLCALSPKEIGQAFLVDTQTIDRRLHRGKARLRELGELADVDDLPDVEERRGSVLQALYLLFSEGYHGSNPSEPVRPLLCTDALRLAELMLDPRTTAHPDVHALAALFCFGIARLRTRLDADGVFVPFEEQDRSSWDGALIERGLVHLAASAAGTRMSRWHLEAGIACEHVVAPSVGETDWARIVALYDLLMVQSPGPVVALNRALAMAERDGIEAGRRQLVAVAEDPKLARYPFYWAALADLQRRAELPVEARSSYERAIELSRSPAERASYQRRLERLEN